MTQSSEAATPIPDSKQDKSEALVCRACGADVPSAALFCAACGSVHPLAAEIGYFEVFGLPRKLRLDGKELEREFYRLSRRLHPDVYARASVEEQEWSLANSSLLNDAYRTLRDPLKRTEYLLKLEGMLSGDEGGGKKKDDRAPADLLEEVFELNMQLDEMRMSREMGENDPQLQKDLAAAKNVFDAQLKATDAKLEELWDEWDASLDLGGEKKQNSVKEELAALLDRRRYIRNLVNSVDEALAVK
jgi:molecular chaperone HscB